MKQKGNRNSPETDMKEKLLLTNQRVSSAVVSELFQEFEAMQLVYV